MKKLIAFIIALAPSIASAQTLTDLNSVTNKATNIGNTIVTILISVAVIYIIFNVIRYLVAGGEEQRKAGGLSILYGVIALFVILSVWGLVAILRNTFKTQDNLPIDQIRNINLPPPPSN